jgi:hypothetical protein
LEHPIEELQKQRKETWQTCLDHTEKLKTLRHQTSTLHLQSSTSSLVKHTFAWALYLAQKDSREAAAGVDQDGKEPQGEASAAHQGVRRGGNMGEGAGYMVDIEDVRVLVVKTREGISTWHESAGEELKELSRRTDEGAACLEQQVYAACLACLESAAYLDQPVYPSFIVLLVLSLCLS